MRNILFSILLFAAQPAFAATQSVEFSVTFERDFFQDGFFYESGSVKKLDGGALDGVSGAFSGLKPGESVSVAVELEGHGPFYSLTSCVFGEMSCSGNIVYFIPGESLLITDYIKTLNFNFETGEAFFFEDNGVEFDEGFFRSYGADFVIQSDLSAVPLPLSATLLIAGVALLGFKRRRKD